MDSRQNFHDVFTAQQTDLPSTQPLPQRVHRLAVQATTILRGDLSIMQRNADAFIFDPRTLYGTRNRFERLFPFANGPARGPCSQPRRRLARFRIGETVQAYIMEVPEADDAAEIIHGTTADDHDRNSTR